MRRLYFSLLLTLFCCSNVHTYNDLVVEDLRNQQVHFVNFLFTDIFGNIKEILLPLEHVENALENGIVFDGSSIAGCSNICQSDMILKPDVNSLRIIPWLQGVNKTALMMCDIYMNEREPFVGDPRYILKTVAQEIAQQGYACNVGPELEFFLLNADNAPIDKNAYFSVETDLKRVIQNQSIIHLLRSIGINVEKFHHEVASGQHEFSIRYGEPLAIADQVVLAKYTLKSVMQEYGINVTFMPKPFANQNGSAMHIHFSLWDIFAHKNAFYDEDDAYQMSDIGKQFIAGVLHHIPEITALLNPTINSYKRLVPGYEAPIYICWGSKNRSALVRIPETNRPNSVRAELRCPDPTCNPYLAFASLLKSGIDGVIHQLPIPSAAEENLYKLSKQQLIERKVSSLPNSLAYALHQLEQSDFMRILLGSKTLETFVALKKQELRAFNTYVTDWEIERYL